MLSLEALNRIVHHLHIPVNVTGHEKHTTQCVDHLEMAQHRIQPLNLVDCANFLAVEGHNVRSIPETERPIHLLFHCVVQRISAFRLWTSKPVRTIKYSCAESLVANTY